ncbi:MAG: 30S ribosomal protein S2 [Candidatus Giovannonibacteria bacterium GW2011_GWA2_53_7]|uniref:Small ribosomal subunit protein uS2 n=1 Tax=Candidatus Giovannonibacteria bacterium GW2011_GWA2_53_7 TaxID=1618650 RepID=A0A0G1XVY5_9BACT|nr:MAG: 30S ribosomal protein S2 [Candidatus Giovannonibacteria bacterium GW2011_GWA2_53_7]
METMDIDTLFSAGAHFGYSRARRHPSATPFLFATRDQTDFFNLEETAKCLEAASAFVSSVVAAGGQVVFVSGKNESLPIVKAAAERIGAPYCAGRWIGGTLTNFKNIRKRIDRLEKLEAERESGVLEKYTKKERLLLDREMEGLRARFGGLVSLQKEPAALFVVDTRHEDTAVREANQLGIPVVGLSSSDCNFSMVQYPIPANDTSVKSVRLIVERIADAHQEGKKVQPARTAESIRSGGNVNLPPSHKATDGHSKMKNDNVKS